MSMNYNGLSLQCFIEGHPGPAADVGGVRPGGHVCASPGWLPGQTVRVRVRH